MFKLNNKVLSTTMALMMTIGTAGYTYAKTAPTTFKLTKCEEQNKFINAINGERAFGYIKTLADDIGPRIAGTEEEYEGVKFIKAQFDKLGYETEIQEFEYASGKGTSTVKLGEEVIESEAFTGSKVTQESLTGEIVYCGLGGVEDYQDKDVNGKIVLVERGTNAFTDKVTNAANAGAIGLVMYNNTSGISSESVGEVSVPAVGIDQATGKSLVEKLEAGEIVELSIEVGGLQSTTSWNVIAKQAARGNDSANTNEIVYVTAHHDSVPKAPGANDNASGVASMIEIANAIKDLDTDREIRFIACGAEEVGLQGSSAYVKSLTQDEKSRSIGSFNLDMVATAYGPASELAVYTNKGKENIVTDAVAEAGKRLASETTKFTSYDGNHEKSKNGNLVAMGSSDHVPFDNAGIPTALFINGDPTKLDDPRSALEPYYHKPEDHTGNASQERLERSIKLIGSAIYETVDVDHENLVSVENMMKDLEAIATNDNARVTGFEGEHKSADYIVNQFKEAGLKTRKQMIKDIDGYISEGSTVKVGDNEIESATLTYSNSGKLDGELVDCGVGKPEEIKKVKGKIALIQRGELSFVEKVDNAQAAGAKGVILYNNAEGDFNGTLGEFSSKRVPSTTIGKKDGEQLVAKLKAEEKLSANLEVKTEVEQDSYSYNVIASLPAAKNPRTAQTIVVGAHMDSVQCAGANDNATGTVSIMEAARILSQPEMAEKLNYNIEFVAFGAEEIGLIGSKEYVKSLQDSGKINKVKSMINLDMVGVGNDLTLFNSSKSTSHEVSDLAKKVADQLGYLDTATTQDLHSTASDHAPFEAVGVPSTFLTYRMDKSGTLDPYYHRKTDVIPTINPQWLVNTTDVVVNTVLEMQSQPKRDAAKSSVANYNVDKVESDELTTK